MQCYNILPLYTLKNISIFDIFLVKLSISWRKSMEYLKKNLVLLIVAIALKLILTGFFPQYGFNENVRLYGFPSTFFTLYTRQFHVDINSPMQFTFTIDLLQFIVNIISLYLILWGIWKLLNFFYLKLRECVCRM